jgi:cell division protein FtsB
MANQHTPMKTILNDIKEEVFDLAEENVEQVSDTAYMKLLDISQKIDMMAQQFQGGADNNSITSGRDGKFTDYIREMRSAVDASKGSAPPRPVRQRGPIPPTIEIPINGGTVTFRQLRDSISLRNGRTHSQRDQTEANLVALVNHLIENPLSTGATTSMIFELQDKLRETEEERATLEEELRDLNDEYTTARNLARHLYLHLSPTGYE